jgi:hypothetical protein
MATSSAQAIAAEIKQLDRVLEAQRHKRHPACSQASLHLPYLTPRQAIKASRPRLATTQSLIDTIAIKRQVAEGLSPGNEHIQQLEVRRLSQPWQNPHLIRDKYQLDRIKVGPQVCYN